MTEFGVTKEGFVLKPFEEILRDAQQRVRDAFGADIDLSPTSTLAKILQVTADEDALLWRRLEDVYYSQFVSTASGTDLDLLGDDAGIVRRHLFAEGQVELTIEQPQPERVYVLPEGAILLTRGTPSHAFHTTAAAKLSATAPRATVPARAFEEGPLGNIPAGAIVAVDPDYLADHLEAAGPTTVTATNPAPFDGGQRRESDVDYRARQLGFPREMWTEQRVLAAALGVRGVLDVLLSGPLGGADVSQSFFNLFLFNQRAFGAERPTGEPYFIDVVVAHEPTRPWRSTSSVVGIYERVRAEIELVRPAGIFFNIVEAQHVEVGVRATVIADPGMDAQAIQASLTNRLAADLGSLRLGGDVLFSQVMRALVEQPGVLDVQDLRLRRAPAAAQQLTAGGVAPAEEVIERATGENLELGPTEIATFRVGSELFDVVVIGR